MFQGTQFLLEILGWPKLEGILKANTQHLIRLLSLFYTTTLISGCVTPAVYNLGATPRKVEIEDRYVASDGSVALETNLIQKSGKSKRYFYKDSEAIRNIVQSQPRHDNDFLDVT